MRNWVSGLNGDWLISRQRFFGVPIPVWYPLDENGDPVYDKPLVPSEDALPIDLASQSPEGYEESQRGRAGGFVGDPDVMDTWATSSLSPQIAGGWRGDPELFATVFPMDVRPQAHDIIRTWLFATMVRAHFEHDSVPWHNAAISGWILDPDRKKMSKSKGNVVTPEDVVIEHSADAVRYWAASGRLGSDAAYDTGQMEGRAPPGHQGPQRDQVRAVLRRGRHLRRPRRGRDQPPDRAMLAALGDVVEKATAGFEAWDYTRSLEVTETFFWTFCDDYLELVKDRAYGGQGEAEAASARAALRLALETLLRLLAPFLPYVTEEVWSWWHDGSVHRAAWPLAAEVATTEPGDPALLAAVGEALAGVRKAKSEAKVGMRAEVARIELAGPAAWAERVRAVEADLRATGRITGTLDYAEAETLEVRGAEPHPGGEAEGLNAAQAVRLDRDPRDIPPREPQPASGEAGLVEQADQSCARVVDVQQAVAVSREHEDDVARQDGIADVQQRRLTVADHLEEATNAARRRGAPGARNTPTS